jgi:hypothetical protein
MKARPPGGSPNGLRDAWPTPSDCVSDFWYTLSPKLPDKARENGRANAGETQSFG